MNSHDAQSGQRQDSSVQPLPPFTYMSMPSANRSRLFSEYATEDFVDPTISSSAVDTTPTSSDADFWSLQYDVSMLLETTPGQAGPQLDPTNAAAGSARQATSMSAATAPLPPILPQSEPRTMSPYHYLENVRDDVTPTGRISLRSQNPSLSRGHEGTVFTRDAPDHFAHPWHAGPARSSPPDNTHWNLYSSQNQEIIWRDQSSDGWTLPQTQGHHMLMSDPLNGAAQVRSEEHRYAHGHISHSASITQMSTNGISSATRPTGSVGSRAPMIPQPLTPGPVSMPGLQPSRQHRTTTSGFNNVANTHVRSNHRRQKQVDIATGTYNQQPLPVGPMYGDAVNGARQRQTADQRWFYQRILPRFPNEYRSRLSDYFSRLSPREQSDHEAVQNDIYELHDELRDDRYSPITRELAQDLASSCALDYTEPEFRKLLHQLRRKYDQSTPPCKWVVRKSFLKGLGPMPDWQSKVREVDKRCDVCCELYGTMDPEGVQEEPVELPECKHVFGEICLKTWLQEADSSISCPKCRSKLPTEPAWAQWVTEKWRLSAIKRRNVKRTEQTGVWARSGHVDQSAAVPRGSLCRNGAVPLPPSVMPQTHLNPALRRAPSPPRQAFHEVMKAEHGPSESEDTDAQGFLLSSPLMSECDEGGCDNEMADSGLPNGVVSTDGTGDARWPALISSDRERSRHQGLNLMEAVPNILQYDQSGQRLVGEL